MTTIVKHFGGEMAVKLPHLWDAMVGPLRNTIDISNFGVYIFLSWTLKYYLQGDTHLNQYILIDGKSLLEKGDGPAQELVNSLQVFETAAASMDSELHPLVTN